MVFWLVSRYSGEQNWIEFDRMPCDSTLVDWLDPGVTPGDIVLGALTLAGGGAVKCNGGACGAAGVGRSRRGGAEPGSDGGGWANGGLLQSRASRAGFIFRTIRHK